jgi:serine phosphatase RsbU (regulator of sigma subunit)
VRATSTENLHSPEAGPEAATADAPTVDAASQVTEQLAALQAELANLRKEVNFRNRRDETLNFQMFRLDEELRLAARLQQDFLPKSLPQVGPIHFHTLYRPAGYVSGDIYDVSRLDEAHLGFYIADAVGHGMPAALLTMFIKNALVTKEILPGGYRLLDPGEALSRLNVALVEQNLSHATFATALYGTINVNTLMCCFAGAGHPPPLIVRADGSILNLHGEGALLGIFPEERYGYGQVQLHSGDRLFVYTDGIEVAFSGDQASNAQQWRDEIQRRCHLPTDEILKDLSESLDRETGSLTPMDDISIIVAEVK